MKATEIRLENTLCILCNTTSYKKEASGADFLYHVSNQEFQFVRCANCGHIYLNPRPLIEDSHLIYPDDYYTRSGRHTNNESLIISYFKKMVINRRLSFFRKRLNLDKSHVLDVGCGDGSLCISLKNMYPNAKITGIDISFSQETLRACTKAGVQLIESPVENAEFPENAYDLIIMNQLIEHLWEPKEAIDALFRSLKPGGFISIETPNTSGYTRSLFPEGIWSGYYFPRHLNLFNFARLKNFLENAGFIVVKQYSLFEVLIWVYSFRALLEKKSSRFYRFFSDTNPVCLAFFTMIDFIATALGKTTSNQKTIVLKP